MITFNALLTDKKEVAQNVFLLTFENGANYHFDFKAGQYIIATIPSGKGDVKRLYSLASSPNNKSSFSLLVGRVEGGVGSLFLSSLSPGNRVALSGPAGLFSLQQTPSHKVFLSTGTGLAPILSFLSTYKNMRTSLFWGIQTMRGAHSLDFFRKTREENPLFDYHICLSKEAAPINLEGKNGDLFFSGRIDKAMEFYMGPIFQNLGRNSFEYYICGSRLVVESLKTQLLSLGVEKSRVFFEKY